MCLFLTESQLSGRNGILSLVRPGWHCQEAKGLYSESQVNGRRVAKKGIHVHKYQHEYPSPLLSLLKPFSLPGALCVFLPGPSTCKPCPLGLAALQEVMAKVQSEPMQELPSKCSCAAAEAGTAALPRQLWGRTMTGCSSCADNWRGEQRQGRWWLLSSPRLAGSISDWLNMTELTLLSYSEGKRKPNRVKRL